MKKYKFGLFALLFVLGLFIFNTDSVEAIVAGCSSTTNYSATTGEPCGTTTMPPDYQSPVISGVSGPQYLDVNGTGTWTVKAYDRNGGSLSYGVVWGDEIYASLLLDSSSGKRPIMQQSATFTHSYSQAGDYTPTFIVTNDNGQSASTSLNVQVGKVTTLQPSIMLTASSEGVSGQYITVNPGSTFLISGEPKNLGRGYSRAFFFDQNFGNANSCSNNSTSDSVWTMTCGPANTSGSSYFYVEIYQNGKTHKSNTVTVNISDSVTSNVTVLSPNGGEAWVKGTTQIIKWKDKIDFPTCPPGAYCVSPAPRTYDVTLNLYQPPCTTNSCPTYPYFQPRTIAKNVSGSSYNWTIPNWSGNSQDSSAFEVPAGKYKIKVCQTGTANCDSSNAAFSIISGTPTITPPTFDCKNGYDVNTGFRCGCTSTSGYSSYDGNSCAPTTTPTPVCKNGFDSTTGFRCGCTSTQGYSAYDGKSCRLETLPSGCTSVYGYSSTTGELCNGKTTITPITTCTITSTLRLGSSGADVSCLQSRIGLISDGKFGPRTLIAVKAFQANAGLKADGVVGPKSISALEVAN